MQLSDKSGVKCDQCGTDQKNIFVYYSADFKHIGITNNQISRADMRNPPIFSIDVCEACFSKWTELIKTHYKALDVGLICDLSGTRIPANGAFYHSDITKVMVNVMSKQVTTDAKHVELCLYEGVYNDIKNKLIQIRQASPPSQPPQTQQAQSWSSTAE